MININGIFMRPLTMTVNTRTYEIRLKFYRMLFDSKKPQDVIVQESDDKQDWKEARRVDGGESN